MSAMGRKHLYFKPKLKYADDWIEPLFPKLYRCCCLLRDIVFVAKMKVFVCQRKQTLGCRKTLLQNISMKRDIPAHLKHDANSAVLNFLTGTSSHSELSEFFHKIVVGLDEAETFTPADRPYAHYFIYANSTVFGFCESMRSVTFLLPEQLHTDAISNGGSPHKHLANQGWFDFPAFGSSSELNHIHWAERAYQEVLP